MIRPPRLAVAASAVVSWGGLAVLGVAELARGAVGPGVVVAVAVETALVLAFASHLAPRPATS